MVAATVGVVYKKTVLVKVCLYPQTPPTKHV
jgi:hypothetical protein